ncbi:uncharacterized protein GIQ15_03606 [Arthroderma uncinatum]|uniref:uncharacterized protein n=1 Tax=Arthroderma uncinatum TaxID=74035 RepID=UPI00144AA4AC|nr:uncharacterized protein GIQ15_03606 [Arthroderma uncinatum]KAF3484282.1 hypothetical protein GIQ15_03606 [Arthroderma uncinatum]
MPRKRKNNSTQSSPKKKAASSAALVTTQQSTYTPAPAPAPEIYTIRVAHPSLDYDYCFDGLKDGHPIWRDFCELAVTLTAAAYEHRGNSTMADIQALWNQSASGTDVPPIKLEVKTADAVAQTVIPTPEAPSPPEQHVVDTANRPPQTTEETPLSPPTAEQRPKTYAQAATTRGPAPPKPRSKPKNRTDLRTDSRTTSRDTNPTPASLQRFTLIMETQVGEDFNPVTIRDNLNKHLPFPEVVGVARSRQGNLVVTCRSTVEAVLKCQHLWMPGLPPVKRVQDEDRWARRILYLKQPVAASTLEQEIRDYNSAKLAAAPGFIGTSTVILFFADDREAPRELYLLGTRFSLARYKPKPRSTRHGVL